MAAQFMIRGLIQLPVVGILVIDSWSRLQIVVVGVQEQSRRMRMLAAFSLGS
jgi:hypothetical protein